jgi:hypothetical protein
MKLLQPRVIVPEKPPVAVAFMVKVVVCPAGALWDDVVVLREKSLAG